MKICGFRIDGFGRFADREFGPLECPVTVFHGSNEAGKSTLLAFLRTVLFGFPPRRADQYYPPLSGGRHGGRLSAVDRAGDRYLVQRVRGKGGGPVTVTDAAGQSGDAAALSRLLGHHTRDVFENIFAFTLDELHSDALLRNDSVNSQIYSAGMGAAKLPAAFKDIESKKHELFRKGGSKHRMAEAGRQLGEVESRLGEVANNAALYGELTARLEEVRKELDRLNVCRRKYQSELDRERRLKDAWPDWNTIVTAEKALAELPVIEDFPVDGIARLRELEERHRAARREYDNAQEEVAAAAAKAEVPIEHEAVLAYSDDIRRLVERRDAFDKAVGDLPLRQSEMRRAERALQESLRELGTGFDETRLEKFDLSIAVREQISQLQERLREADAELGRCKNALAQDEAALTEAVAGEQEAQRRLEAAPKPDLDEEQVAPRRTLIRAANTRLLRVESAHKRVADLRDQLDAAASADATRGRGKGGKILAIAGLALGILLSAGGALLGGAAFLPGVAAGLAFAAMAVALLVTGRSSPGAESPLAVALGESLRRGRLELAELESALQRDAASLGIESVDDASLGTLEGALKDAETQLRTYADLADRVQDARVLTERRRSRVERAAAAAEAAGNELEEAQRQWQQWLRKRGLRDTFLPETVVDLCVKVEHGLDRLRELRSLRGRVGEIEKYIDEYIAAVVPLAAAFAVTLDPKAPDSAAAAAIRLARLREEVAGKVGNRTAANKALREAERRLQERQRDRDRVDEETRRLLQAGEAEDNEGFRKRAELYRQRQELERKRSEALERLQCLSGPGERLEVFKKALRETDDQSITDAMRRVEEQLEAVDAKKSDLSTERGSIQERLDGLISEAESSGLRMRRGLLREQLRGHAREWVKLTLAEQLLGEARAKFERERQPGVVRHAERFFREITGGRYTRVYAPLGEQTITVSEDSGDPKEPKQLSRGTREQLFLSLRFGLIRELRTRTEPLPVIVDEVLVNFDPDRALRAAAAFVELSNTNQVLVFTCHPTVVGFFRQAALESGAQAPEVIEIG